jgi:hypothetical protein
MTAALLFLAFGTGFLGTMGFICRRQGVPLRDFIGLFLKEPATLKTWALALAGPALCLLFSYGLTKIGDNASWPNTVGIALARIQFFREIAWGLIGLISIVLGALGAVTFKGQGPGGVSFQLNQDSTSSSITSSAPAKEGAP